MIKKRLTGFTIIEMLIVIFIIGLLAAFVFAGYRSGQKRYILNQSAQQLVSKLREVQNMSLSGSGSSGSRYGYGLYLEPGDDFYIIYHDVNGNSTCQPSDEAIETIYLSDKISISSTSPVPSKLDVFFKSPHPTAYINGNSGIGVSGAITLLLEGTSLTKIITATTAGLIQSN